MPFYLRRRNLFSEAFSVLEYFREQSMKAVTWKHNPELSSAKNTISAL